MKSEEVRGKRKMQIYVDGNAVRSGNGQKEYPFQTISEAAKIARPGDEVLVAPGVYREYVDPANADVRMQELCTVLWNREKL